ncbi:MAG: hypothetical protein Q8P67_05085 [archaeon]|nr:hypothetical protein [archaeon]
MKAPDALFDDFCERDLFPSGLLDLALQAHPSALVSLLGDPFFFFGLCGERQDLPRSSRFSIDGDERGIPRTK